MPAPAAEEPPSTSQAGWPVGASGSGWHSHTSWLNQSGPKGKRGAGASGPALADVAALGLGSAINVDAPLETAAA
jgi:hypothetical protein